eukprot:scaffold844_cov254-Pinguiococcus_pyrenoidosus.AAC.9
MRKALVTYLGAREGAAAEASERASVGAPSGPRTITAHPLSCPFPSPPGIPITYTVVLLTSSWEKPCTLKPSASPARSSNGA